MNCVICREGRTKPGTATVTLERLGLTLVVRGVPAQICENCGEEYVAENEAKRLLEMGERAAADGVRVEVRDYLAA